MPHNDPAPGDIYAGSPRTDPQGDAHDTRRRVGVVQPLELVVLTLARTTQPPQRGERALRSPLDRSCGLTKPGWWNERYQRPVMRKYFGTDECVYCGTLPAEQKDELLGFWQKLVLLGVATGGSR